MTLYRIHLFGATELTGSADCGTLLAQPKRLALLTYLLLARPHGYHRRDSLVAMFWPELDQDRARSALRKTVHSIRRILDEGIILSRGDEEIGVDNQRFWCDAVAFWQSVHNDELAQALEYFRGDLLGGFYASAPAFEYWLDQERAHFRELAVDAAWALAQRYEKGSDLTQAARWARRVIRLATNDERLLRRVIELLDRAGDHAGAALAYEEFVARLRHEFEMEPAPETKRLIARIRGQL